jgi:hypothetical protein
MPVLPPTLWIAARWVIFFLLGAACWFLRNPLLAGEKGLLWDPLPGLVIGLAWRGMLPSALGVALAPMLGGLLYGLPQTAALVAEAMLSSSLVASIRHWRIWPSPLRSLVIWPLAAGVTLAGSVLEQVFAAGQPMGSGFGNLWAGRALGVAAVAPLVAHLGSDFLSRFDLRLFFGWVVLTALLLVVGSVAAIPDLDPAAALALGLIPLVILFWQAMRFGTPGASTACFLVALLAGLGWADGHPLLSSMPTGFFALALAGVLGTAQGVAALLDERQEMQSWKDSAAQAHQIVFWRWRRGEGMEWGDPQVAAGLGLAISGGAWKGQGGWRTMGVWPAPTELKGVRVLALEDGGGCRRWLEFSGAATAHDTEGKITEVIGTAADITARQEAQTQREKLLRRETELRILRSQLHPHVIFNALNRIASLVMSDSERGRDLLVRLSRLLRATLLAGEKAATTWKEEAGLISDYIRLEQAGLEERLRFNNSIPADADPVSLPALSLFCLVEGAVRRGVGMRKEGASIQLSQKGPRVFRVEVDPPVPAGEAEFPPWPDPLWVERLEVERPRRARIVAEREADGNVRAVELHLEPPT